MMIVRNFSIASRTPPSIPHTKSSNRNSINVILSTPKVSTTTMMIYKALLFASVLPSTIAGGTIRKRDSDGLGLGSKYLQTVNSATNDTPQASMDGSISADVMGEFMASLSQEISDACIAEGRVEYESSYTDSATGEVQNYSITCRLQTTEAYDTVFMTMRDAIAAAMPTSTSSSSNLNYYYPGDGHKEGLEMLLNLAQTLEEVMLIVPSYQNYGYPYQSSNSINVNLNKAYVYEEHEEYTTSSPSPSVSP
eukprot:scaffold450_cov175-Amphora_coffeaeformis.AAC.2